MSVCSAWDYFRCDAVVVANNMLVLTAGHNSACKETANSVHVSFFLCVCLLLR